MEDADRSLQFVFDDLLIRVYRQGLNRDFQLKRTGRNYCEELHLTARSTWIQTFDSKFDDTMMIFNDFNEQERVRIVRLVDDKVLVFSTSNVEEFKQFFTEHSRLKRVFQVKNVCQIYLLS